MEKELIHVAFARANEPISFLMTLFGIIQKEEWKIYAKSNGNRVEIGLRDPAEIVKLNLDMSSLHAKFALWHISGEKELHLTDEELTTLRHAIYCAYYFITEAGHEGHYSPFIKYYNFLKGQKAI